MHVAAGTGRVVAGRYYLQDPIGRGAMGTVWRARDELLARDVAVKEVLLRGASTPDDTRVRYERTLREARTAARLNHPGVVTIFDVVEADGRPWIVMELVPARSLEQILAQDGPLPPGQAADVGVRLLGALATAHAAGILHRDVKPSNVLLGRDGRAVLTDFGIATLAGDPGLTQVGMVMGTPGFTAPERIRGEPATPASDLWSLGATLFAAVDGRGPFDHHGSSLAVLSMIANEDAPKSRSAGALGPAIDALLQRDPNARPDAHMAGRLLAAAAAAPPDNGSPGGGHRRDGFQDAFQGSAFPAAFGAGAFQAGAFHGSGWPDPGLPDPGFQGPRFQAPRFQGAGFQGAGFQGDPFGGNGFQPDTSRTESAPPDTFPPDTFPPDTSPDASPASSAVPPGGRPAAARPTAPQAAAVELPAWLSPPPVESPPDGIGPVTGDSLPVLIGVLDDARAARPRERVPPLPPNLPRRPDLPRRPKLAWRRKPARIAGLPARIAGLPAPAGPPGGTGLPSPGTALLRAAGHPPGRHGARVARNRHWLLTGLGAVAFIGAGILGGLAIGHSGSSALPAGYQWYTVPAAQTGTAAGFTMAIPNGWHPSTHGLVTDVVDPAGHSSVQVDLTPFEAGSAFGEASLLEERAVTDGSFPGYRRVELRSFLFHGTLGARWEFTWHEPGLGREGVLDVLFREHTPVGRPAYRIQVSAPSADRAASQAIFAEVLRTFEPR